jgi:hypothetical protein
MNTPIKSNPFNKLLDIYVEELLSLSDAEVLDGDDPIMVQKEGLAMLEKAKAQAGQRRLATARARLEKQKSELPGTTGPAVSAQEARAFLLKAANDRRYTLAARGLNEMSDEDALRLYEQIKRIEDAGNDKDGPA